jgi:hypothetical protein
MRSHLLVSDQSSQPWCTNCKDTTSLRPPPYRSAVPRSTDIRPPLTAQRPVASLTAYDREVRLDRSPLDDDISLLVVYTNGSARVQEIHSWKQFQQVEEDRVQPWRRELLFECGFRYGVECCLHIQLSLLRYGSLRSVRPTIDAGKIRTVRRHPEYLGR